ncbi:acetyl-CoA C-acyltransferase [Solimonas sp. K1W22B-7]|uniref:acetyl-CoA C-acetyltransferase n=1 Tax=Solimonas sp. K1W22B-7 TaxID=2303331 RepID=UPI000E330F15|nr:acetyl-CoA C-acetyltransferase [Solimonas sp. K1W22B-7]AXQ30590.1 acetyl-CoA C-acyltransferase [Solimonas sp. K1W22B-7]
MKEAWIVDAVRTPRSAGKIGKGKLAHLHPQHLLATVLAGVAARNSLNTADIDDVIVGCGTQAGKQGLCIARSATLLAGWSREATAYTVDRYCGSSLTAVNAAAMAIMSGMQELVVGGGVEMMSYHATLAINGYPMYLIDSDNPQLRRMYPTPHQGVCADVIAAQGGYSRAELDALALESQKRAGLAVKEGRFARSLVPVLNDNGSVALDREDFLRPETTAEVLAQLKPSFAQLYDAPFYDENITARQMVQQRWPGLQVEHVHHAGNSSGVVDGAAALLLASSEYAEAHGLKKRARVRAIANGACEPELMLNAPAAAGRAVLKKAGMSARDIDLFEINEAFAVVALKFMRDLELDPLRVNVNGGAIALGHPIGATGAIIIGALLDEMERQGKATGLATMCTGGGMAPAIIIERV